VRVLSESHGRRPGFLMSDSGKIRCVTCGRVFEADSVAAAYHSLEITCYPVRWEEVKEQPTEFRRAGSND
jgi:hypothetical protein